MVNAAKRPGLGGLPRGFLVGAAAGLTAVALGLGGCIIVAVDGDASEASWSSSRHRSRVIGVNLADVSSATAAQAGIDGSRASIVTDVWSNSAADHAGLKKWDVITSIDGKDWATADAVREAIRSRHGGDGLRLGVVRAGQRIEVTVTVPGE